ncbi:MAG: Wzz/FepE/Etk N-terminal domain-containing protein [Alistipes sp.]|nr:Wzz/FepE/Etk N-terminal domain-containing protein [Alistipes senegalensis]MCM1250982.1 Wzz/FepE/Etk N-terminal domain-containing protein [Alistipes sp.]
MKNEMQENTARRADGEEIDVLELVRKVWAERRLVMRWCGIAAVVAVIVAFSIPKEYTATAVLAPETSSNKNSLGGLGALASMAGINMGNMADADAVNPDLYPDVVESVPFVIELFPVGVETVRGDLKTDLFDYLKHRTRRPWWGVVASAPFKALGWGMSLFRGKKPESDGTNVDPFRLTEDEDRIVEELGRRVAVTVDKKTSLVTLSVTMQDPLIAATVADTVMRNLQTYVTDYRTNKARNDLKFTQQLYDESQRDYYSAQQRYARYMDANQNIVRRSVRTEQERLQNEVNLTYSVYNQMAQQLQLARAKVQESTPVYAVVKPATVPLRAAKPSKPLILAGFVFLAFAAAAGWILFGRELRDRFREKKE